MKFQSIISSLTNLFLTPRCFWCREMLSPQQQVICSSCEAFLPFIDTSCRTCGEVLPINVDSCGRCQKSVPSFDRVISVFRYQLPVDTWIQALKFHQQIIVARVLSFYLIKRIRTSYHNDSFPSHILAVPLHNHRLKSRGFNQAQIIAKQLKKAFPTLSWLKGCYRRKVTDAQSGLGRVQRGRNLKDAFVLKSKVNPKHVVVIDDVMTTGETAAAVADCLKANGVERVDIWCLARTERQRCEIVQ